MDEPGSDRPSSPGAPAVDLYLVKHAHAVGSAPGEPPDEDRALSPIGRDEADRIGRHLATMGVRPDAIVASTRPRASQTAAILARHLGQSVGVDVRLTAGCDRSALEAVLVDAGNPGRVVVVGHAFCFAPLIADITGQPGDDLRSGAVARIDASRPLAPGARLIWIRPTNT